MFKRRDRSQTRLRLMPPASDTTVVSGDALSASARPLFSLAIVDPTAAGGRRDGCDVLDTWLSGASSVMTPDHHVFIVCPSGEEAALQPFRLTVPIMSKRNQSSRSRSEKMGDEPFGTKS